MELLTEEERQSYANLKDCYNCKEKFKDTDDTNYYSQRSLSL